MRGYSSVTELPGGGASQEQLSMLYSRYKFASEFCRDKEVLEVACGAGLGLGYLAQIARKVVGGDIDEENLRWAKDHYERRQNIEVQKMDAHHLPFKDGSFDVILLFEALYYLEEPDRFFSECRRVLRKDGTLLVCTVNKDWTGFNPSPMSTRYFSAPELSERLKSHGFQTGLYAAFPEIKGSFKQPLLSWLKRAAVRLRLIPKTMKGKEALKRIFFGRLAPLPSEVREGMAEYVQPILISGDFPDGSYKVFFAVGRVFK